MKLDGLNRNICLSKTARLPLSLSLSFIHSTQILTSAKTKMADVLTSALTHKVVTFVTAEMDS